MKKTVIKMTSIGYKILIIILTMAILSLNIIFFAFSLPWYGCAFLTIVSAALLFGCYLFFNHRFILLPKQKLLKISVITTKTLKIEDIYEIKINTENSVNPKKHCFIVIILKNGQFYKTSEYATLIKHNAVKITEEKIRILNEQIKSNNLNKHSKTNNL